MNAEAVVNLGREALELTLLVSAPLLGAALVAGLVVSIFQAATQINEMTLSFIPKLLALAATLVFAGPWIIALLTDFITRLYSNIPQLVN